MSTNEDTPLSVTLSGSDPDGDTIRYTVATNPAHGTLSGNAPNLTYTPNANYNGTDTFTFTVTDTYGVNSTATVRVTVKPVNDPPVAVNDTAKVDKNGSARINVLANDRDSDGDKLTVTSITQSAVGGNVALNSDGMVTYTAKNGFTGTATFTYTISDGHGGTASATVTVTVSK